MDTNITKFFIWIQQKNSRFNQKAFNDKSILKDYNSIIELNQGMNNNNQVIIILNHPKLNNLQINNKKEWDFLYNNNIINECIENIIINKQKNISRNILKINYIYQNSDIEVTKYQDIINYIINNITPDVYITHLLNFLKKRNELINEFKLYLINILLNSNNVQENNNQTKNSSDIVKNDNENKFIIKDNEFFKILENRFNELKNFYKKKLGENISSCKIDSLITNYDTSAENENSSKSVFSRYESNINLFRTDEINNNLFKTLSKNEYYIGIEEFKDKLRRTMTIS